MAQGIFTFATKKSVALCTPTWQIHHLRHIHKKLAVCIKFHEKSFLLANMLTNTQEKLPFFILHHVIRQTECFPPLVMVTSTKKGKMTLGIPCQHHEFIKHCTNTVTQLNLYKEKFQSFCRICTQHTVTDVTLRNKTF
jgi:hypothetical protein